MLKIFVDNLFDETFYPNINAAQKLNFVCIIGQNYVGWELGSFVDYYTLHRGWVSPFKGEAVSISHCYRYVVSIKSLHMVK